MRTAVTLTKRVGKDSFDLSKGPNVPIQEHLRGFKEFARMNAHPTLAAVEVWTSDGGLVRSRTFRAESANQPPAKSEPPAKPTKKQ